MKNATKCKAANPATCRYHGTPGGTKVTTTFADFLKKAESKKHEFLESLPKKVLTTDVVLDETFHVEGVSRTGDYQQGWFKTPEGEPVAFVKLKVVDTVSSTGEVLTSGPAICDFEVNPKYAGRNAALAVVRMIKKTFNAEQAWMGDMVSEQGYHMYKKFRGHEILTGETLLKLNPWHKEEDVIPGKEKYTFVSDWDTLKAKYRI